MAAVEARAGQAVEDAQGVLGHGVEGYALGQHALHIGDETFDGLQGRGDGRLPAEQLRIHAGQQPGGVIGGAAGHDAVHMGELPLHLFDGIDFAVDDDLQIGPAGLQAMHAGGIERRLRAVLLRRDPIQPSLACMDDKGFHTGIGHHIDEAVKTGVLVHVIDANAALDGDGQIAGPAHGGGAGGDGFRLLHQGCAEAALAHPVGRAAHIDVDGVIAELRDDGGGGGHFIRIGAADLEDHRVFLRREAEQTRAVSMEHRAGCDHLGIENGAARQNAVKPAAMAVRPFHHGGDGECLFMGAHGGL